MAKIERNKKATNPNRRPMSVADMTDHRLMKQNELALKILDEFCKRQIRDPDMTTQINGEKRVIAKNLFKKYPFMSVQDVAEITRLPMEQVVKLEREVR